MIYQKRCHRSILAVGAFLFMTAPLSAGVVYEIEVKDHEQSPPKTESIEAAVEGRHLKMGSPAGQHSGDGDMIFNRDRREMVFVDHDDKSYMVMDEASMRQVAGQVSDAMSQMQGQMQEMLKNAPADQREMIEKMMKERMPGQQPQRQKAPKRVSDQLKKTGEKGKKAGYPCVKYEVWHGGRKTQELWVTDWDNLEGGEQMGEAFEDMAEFFHELMDSMPDFGQGDDGMSDNVFAHMKELGGFPVVTRDFGDDGSLESEGTLRSARRRTLDPDAFEPPAGYKRRSMFPE